MYPRQQIYRKEEKVVKLNRETVIAVAIGMVFVILILIALD